MVSRIVPIFSLALLVGCQTAYYDTMEQFGVHKREILVDRVAEARDSQIESKEQFETALESFKSVVDFDGGDLEGQYEKLSKEYERSDEKAEAVTERIDAVENVAEALFDEWEDELDEYSNANYRRIKEGELKDARQRYAQLISSMRRAESKIDPVMAIFRDQVLFLKHSLNAAAIASLRNEMVSVQADITALIEEMEKSIKVSNEFIESIS